MNWLLITVLLLVCVWLVGMGMSKPGRIYEFPFLAGATFIGFVLPQLPALAEDEFLPRGAFAMMAFFTILCTAACGVGWRAARRPLPRPSWSFDERRLLLVAAALSLLGAFFFFKLGRLPEEVRMSSQYTGLPVAYLFFAKLLSYGFAIAALCVARRPSSLGLAVCAFDTMFYMDRILIAGRRGDLFEFLMIIAIALWFQRGFAAPRAAALAAMLAAALALTSTGNYRSISQDERGPEWSEVSKIDVVGNFKELLKDGGPELRNATMRIYHVDHNFSFDYGLFHWNTLIFNFVPAQLVGTELKSSLMVNLQSQYDPSYEAPTGSTETGMADAFASFWYFGAVKFFLVAYLLGRVYRSAMAGNVLYQLVYLLTMVPAMQIVTHHTQWVPSTWVHMLLLLVPFLLLARVRRRARSSAGAISGTTGAPSCGPDVRGPQAQRAGRYGASGGWRGMIDRRAASRFAGHGRGAFYNEA